MPRSTTEYRFSSSSDSPGGTTPRRRRRDRRRPAPTKSMQRIRAAVVVRWRPEGIRSRSKRTTEGRPSWFGWRPWKHPTTATTTRPKAPSTCKVDATHASLGGRPKATGRDPADVDEHDRMRTGVGREAALAARHHGDDDETEGALHLQSRCDACEPRRSSEGDRKGSGGRR